MANIGIFYGTTTGNSELVADMIRKAFGESEAEMINVDVAEKGDVEKFRFLIFGVSTWGVSDLQDDFEDFLGILETVDFTGKKVALFGLGDQSTYGDTFVDAMGIFYQWLKKRNVQVVGSVSRKGYSFRKSMALIKDKLVGLALDEEYESHLTRERVAGWVDVLKKEFII